MGFLLPEQSLPGFLRYLGFVSSILKQMSRIPLSNCDKKTMLISRLPTLVSFQRFEGFECPSLTRSNKKKHGLNQKEKN